MDNMVAGEPSELIQTRTFNLTVQKELFGDMGDTAITDKYTKFQLPSLEEMGLGLDPNLTRKYSSVELSVSHCCYNHGQKSLRHMKITNLYSLGVNSPLSPRER